MHYRPDDTAVVVIDPQNDVLSPAGKNWAVLGASVTENDVVAHLAQILGSARDNGFAVFVSPHYFYPHDHRWSFNGPLEDDELSSGTFARTGVLTWTAWRARVPTGSPNSHRSSRTRRPPW